jgi:hypothetical protein
LINEIQVLGSAIGSETPSISLVLDKGAIDYTGGKEYLLGAGLYRVTVSSGAISRFASDSDNGGRAWESHITVSNPASGHIYPFGYLNNNLSTYSTYQEAEKSLAGRSIVVYVPFRSAVYFWIESQGSSTLRGQLNIKVEQISGSTRSLVNRVSDAMLRSVLWQQRAIVGGTANSSIDWLGKSGQRQCYACHQQSQAVRGFNESLWKFPDLPIEERLREDLFNALVDWQKSNGSVNDGRADTSLWSWAFSSYEPERLRSRLDNLLRSLDWLVRIQNSNGSWNNAHNDLPLNDGNPSAGHTMEAILALDGAIRSITGGTPTELVKVADSRYKLFPDQTLATTFTGGSVPVTSGYIINNNQITISQPLPSSYKLHFKEKHFATAVKLTISDDFSRGGESYISEIRALKDGIHQPFVNAYTNAVANSTDTGLDRSYNYHQGLLDNWNSARDSRRSPVQVMWVLKEPTEIDSLELVQFLPHHIKNFRVEFVSAINPNLSTIGQPVAIESISTGSSNNIRFSDLPPSDYIIRFNPVPNATGIKLVMRDRFSGTNYITEVEALNNFEPLEIVNASTNAPIRDVNRSLTASYDRLEGNYNGWLIDTNMQFRDVHAVWKFTEPSLVDGIRLVHQNQLWSLKDIEIYVITDDVPELYSVGIPVRNVRLTSGNPGRVKLNERLNRYLSVDFEPLNNVTALSLNIYNDFNNNSLNNINQVLALNRGEMLSFANGYTNGVSTSTVNSFVNSFNGILGSWNFWSNSTPAIHQTVRAVYGFSNPRSVDRFLMYLDTPNSYLSDFGLSYTTDPQPGLNSHFKPVHIKGLFEGAPSSPLVNYLVKPLIKAGDFLSSADFAATRNHLTAARTIIGLVQALTYLPQESAERARTRIQVLYDHLRSNQNTDGGWSYGDGIQSEYSNALPTAMVLEALMRANRGVVDEVIIRGVEYLLEQQMSGGYWDRGRLRSDLASTTCVEIALPTILEALGDEYSSQGINDLLATGSFKAIELTWTPVKGAIGYNIYRRPATASDDAYVLLATGYKTRSGEYYDGRVENYTPYMYKIRWLNQMGEESSDSNESSGESFGLECALDTPPTIVSAPRTGGVPSGLYTYQVIARDDDKDDELKYQLLEQPSGMTIDSKSGLISWTPSSEQTGTHRVRLQVTDTIGHYALQSYRIFVAPILKNFAPRIVSDPVIKASTNTLYRYQVKAEDENPSDILSYSAESLPKGMSITSGGLITWRASAEQVGEYKITVKVSDLAGASDTQIYGLVVQANAPPRIVSEPPLKAVRLKLYKYLVEATDPEGGLLRYKLTKGPEGMKINSNGILSWYPGTDDIGEHEVALEVSDEGDLTALQVYKLTVPDNEAPVISSTPPKVGIEGEVYRYNVEALDPEGSLLAYSLQESPVGMKIDLAGHITWVPTKENVGKDERVIVKVIDERRVEVRQEYFIRVLPAGSTVDGDFIITLTSPNLQEPLSTPSAVTGTVRATALSTITAWQSTLESKDGLLVFPLGSGNAAVDNDNLGMIDTTLIPNDNYDLVLEARTATKTIKKRYPLSIRGDLKLGEFALGFTDLSLAMNGLSVVINRHYSSLDSRVGDFGRNWRIGYPGMISDAVQEGEPYHSNSRVMMMFPDGRRMGWSFSPEPMLIPFTGVVLGWFPAFKGDPGNDYKLEVVRTFLMESGGSFFNFADPYNPYEFIVTSPDGVRYYMSEKQGVERIVDTNNQSLTFTANEIILQVV